MAVSMAAMDSRRKKKPPLEPLKMAEPQVTDSPVAGSPSPSPAASEPEHHQRSFSLHSIKDKAWKSFTNRDPPAEKRSSSRTPSSHGHARKLSKTRHLSSGSTFELMSRRSSGLSDDHARMSIADSLSTTSSSIVDWKLQAIEGFAPLEPDSQLLKTKKAYLVVTTDYLVKVKCYAHMLAIFPQIAGGAKSETPNPAPEPLLVIPLAGIVSVFVSESPRPSFGAEIWWRTLSGVAFHHTTFFFSLPTERNEQLHHIFRAMRSSSSDENEFVRRSYDVAELVARIHETEEPLFKHQKLEIFPVVPRGHTRKDCISKSEDVAKKSHEGSAFYLVVGAHLCHLVEIQRGKGGEPTCQHRSFGLVTLESFKGDWVFHQERFNITFHEPFKPSVTLELASRYYRQIIRVFGTADRFLKPLWPLMWHTFELFHISGLKEPQYLVSKEDFGSIKRTLDAYLTAYRCRPVEWEINWKTKFAPEFRLLPARDGYSATQLLAVLRALRYNDYFNSLSFRDVDLSVLWGADETGAKKPNIAYLSRSGVTLKPDEMDILKASPVLHQEFHALTYCSETIRHIDFTNSSQSYFSRVKLGKNPSPTLQFLTPILNLLRFDITKCTHLNLSRNLLSRLDIQELSDAMREGKVQSLDVSSCGLDDMGLRDVVVAPVLDGPQPLESLNISGNPGRLAAYIVPQMLENLTALRELNMHGSIKGDTAAPLFHAATLDRLQFLEELDISKFKLNPATLNELELYLHHRSQKIDRGERSRLRKLVLNHCGITGTQAARLLNAINPSSSHIHSHGLELSISGNPLEDGIHEFCAAICESKTPAGLVMDMVEFYSEANYILFINSLCPTQHLSLLSLVGTAPTPDPTSPCNPELVEAFTSLFTCNLSIRCLDLSGFCERLEDGQLSQGFGSSLAALADNQTVTHLRVRSQKLHEDAGTLGRILRENKTLIAFDCQDNEHNLTSLQFLVSCLRENYRLLDFPFCGREKRTIWRNILKGVGIGESGGSGTGAAAMLKTKQEALLEEKYKALFEEIEGYLLRNRMLLEDEMALVGGGGSGAGVIDFEGLVAHSIPRADECCYHLENNTTLPMPTSSGMGQGLLDGTPTYYSQQDGRRYGTPDISQSRTRAEQEHEHTPTQNPAPADPAEQPTSSSPVPNRPPLVSTASTTHLRRATVHSSSIPVDASLLPAAPYHVRGQSAENDGTESPTDTLDPVSEVSTPPPEEGEREHHQATEAKTTTTTSVDGGRHQYQEYQQKKQYGREKIQEVCENDETAVAAGGGGQIRDLEFQQLLMQFKETGFDIQ